jgi:pimeloyl-ACP methyl ester carboxylesterase
MTEPWVTQQRVELPAGAVMVRQAGDPVGTPLVYFHGTPSSRLETSYADGLSAELGIRMVSFDRPGYGESPARPFSLASIARDTADLADALEIDRFGTVGQSGGGPFSLACGAELGDRVTRVGVTSGAGPFMEIPGALDLLDDNDRAAVALLPDSAASAAQFAAGFEPLRSLFQAPEAQIVAGFRAMLSPHDGELLGRAEFATCLATAMRESLRHGTSGGGWDNLAWVGPWDIDLSAVACPVHLWYGEDDPMCRPEAGTWLAEHLPTSTLVLRPGEGHMGVMEHGREILEALAADVPGA